MLKISGLRKCEVAKDFCLKWLGMWYDSLTKIPNLGSKPLINIDIFSRWN